MATNLEYKWKVYTLSQNIQNKMNNETEDGWRVISVSVVGENVYVTFEKGDRPMKVT
jgi:hypothetical protein